MIRCLKDACEDAKRRSWTRAREETHYHQATVSEAPVPEVKVEPDHFDVVTKDVVLVAQLDSTFALCLYDAVLESGALVHLRVGPPGRVQDPELTDTTLSTDLLLLDRCFIESRQIRRSDGHQNAETQKRTGESGGSTSQREDETFG